ncbi:hypothetical protein ACF061_22630 [Streptomyces sp. NPDC015220]|uniref:hypothetical protein n=1 Tax=Streptomyces sp. NPDC015220 TaxID=3364947 RepID=UPI003700B088
MKRDADGAVSDPKALVAPHAERGYDHLIEACRTTAARCPEVRSLTHLTLNAVDFSIRAAAAVPFSDALPWDDEVEVEGRPARRLVRWVTEMDAAMRPLNTGELMRVLAVTRSAGAQCSRLRHGQYVVGVSTTGPGSDAVDDAVNEMVTDLRTNHYQQGNELPGGEPGRRKRSLGAEVPLVMHVLTPDKDEESRLRGIWQRHVNPYDLQYAGYYRRWSPVCVGDAFEHGELADTFLVVSVQTRRALYRDLVFRLSSALVDLADILRPVTREPLERLVLDVQEGAVYLHWLDPAAGDFLVGVTVRQKEVAVAEERLTDLIGEIRPGPR